MENQKLDFENMGIYDLRNYARNIGVLSPTKFKRDELIEKITAIIHGQKPEQKKTNKGRPPKHKINEQAKLDYILPDNLFSNADPRYQQYQNHSMFKIGTSDLLCESNNTATSNILFDGYYKPYDINYGFVLKKGYLSDYYKENVIILNDLANKYNLKEGDYLTGASCYVKNKNLMLATSVISINNKSTQNTNFERFNFNQSKINLPSKKIDLIYKGFIDFDIIDKICPIAKGSRVLINFENKDQTRETMINFLNCLSEKNQIKTFLFTIDDMPEEIYHIAENCPEIQLVHYSFGMERQNFIDMANLVVQHCQRLVEEKNDVAIVFYNAQNFKNNISSNAMITSDLTENSANVYANNKLKDLFCTARDFETGSLTTIFVNLQENILLDVCNTNIKFNKEVLPETDISVDAISSFSRNLKQIVTNDDYKLIEQFKTGLTKENVLEKLDAIIE